MLQNNRNVTKCPAPEEDDRKYISTIFLRLKKDGSHSHFESWAIKWKYKQKIF